MAVTAEVLLLALSVSIAGALNCVGDQPLPTSVFAGTFSLRAVVTDAVDDTEAAKALVTMHSILDGGQTSFPRAVMAGPAVSDEMRGRLRRVATLIEVEPLDRTAPQLRLRALQLHGHVHEILYVAPGVVVRNAAEVRHLLFENYQWCVPADKQPHVRVVASRLRLPPKMPDVAFDYRRAASLLCPRADAEHAAKFPLLNATDTVPAHAVAFAVVGDVPPIHCDGTTAAGGFVTAASRANASAREFESRSVDPVAQVVVHALDIEAELAPFTPAPTPQAAAAHFHVPADAFAVELTFPGSRFHYFWDEPSGRSKLAAAIAADVATIADVHPGAVGVTQLRFAPGVAYFDVHFSEGRTQSHHTPDGTAGRLDKVPRAVWGRTIAVYKQVTGHSIAEVASTVPPPTQPMTRFPVTTRSPPTLSLPPPLPYSPMAPTRSPADPPMEVPVTMGPTDLVLARLMQNQQ